MSVQKQKPFVPKAMSLPVIGIFLLFSIALLLLLISHFGDIRAVSPMMGHIRFDGNYRIGDGPWQEIEAGTHIPATKGDVTLLGQFRMYTPEGIPEPSMPVAAPISLYLNHIHVIIQETGHEPYASDAENPLLGSHGCGAVWTAYTTVGGHADPIEIRIHNPHRLGNESAVDDLLENMAFWDGVDFEQFILKKDHSARTTGTVLMIAAFIILGSALFCTLLQIHGSRMIWSVGLWVLASGMIFKYSTVSIHLYNDLFSLNTVILCLSFMFCYLFFSLAVNRLLNVCHKVGSVTVWALGIMNGLFFLLPILTGIKFYDIWTVWILVQAIANVVLLVCLLREHPSAGKLRRWINAVFALHLIIFEADVLVLALGRWEFGLLSKISFLLLFVILLFLFLLNMPNRIRAAAKAHELELQKSLLEAEKKAMEAELKDSRTSIMLSQIQPHFIYNTLGTIERMCLKDPQKAFDLVRNFSLYLRGNFSELDSVTPIRFSQELNHVKHYVNIEKVRFSDMSVEYQLDATEFVLPALSVQPLVENAIKHGLMQLETGGTVRIRSYETPDHFCVEVWDNGGGFDASLPIDEKSHVGLRNIRGRLHAMVGGTLQVKSTPGIGTTATILIPKEPQE